MIDSITLNYNDGKKEKITLPLIDNYAHAIECSCSSCFKFKIALQWSRIENSRTHSEGKYHELGSFVFDLLEN